MALIGSILYLLFAVGVGLLAILFAAWAFINSFQVKGYLKLLTQIKDELKRLNDYNEEQKQSQAQIG